MAPTSLDTSLAALGVLHAPLCLIRYTTVNTKLHAPDPLLLDTLEALTCQELLFRPVLGVITPNWLPTARERIIIHSAVYGLYPNDVLERVFYDNGGINALIALILVVRKFHRWCLGRWYSISSKSIRCWLARNFCLLFE